MKKRILRTALCLLLLVCLVTALPMQAAATEDTIYVSDLYYGYHTAYMSVPLGNYSIATTEIMAQVYEDFINSPSFIWTKVSGSMSAVTSPKDMFQIVSDAFIETEFTYNDALTAANEKLALGLLRPTSNKDDVTGTASAIVERVNGMGDLLSVIYQDCDLEALTDIEAIDKLFDYMINNNSMKSLTSAQLEQVRTMILDDLQYIGNLTTAVTTIIDLMGGLYMSLVVEDARLTMLDTILPLAEEGTTLHDGLSLLDNQLRGGFATYFFENYVVNEGLDIATTLGKNYLAGVCPPAALAVGLIDLANTVIFDVIFDVPSVDDFMLQTVLTHYSIELHTITRNKLDVFEQAFNSADVVEFERLYAAFSAAVTAGLEATERLTLDSNRDDFAAVEEQYGNYNYEAYINDIIADLYLIDPERRVMKEFTWRPTGSLKVERASNAVKEGYIYECQGAVRGDVYVNNGLTIEADETCVLGGDLYVTNSALKVYGSLHVMGDLEISSGWNMSNYETVRNTGTIQVDGDLSMTYSGNGSAHCSRFNNNGTVDVNGNISLVGPRCYFSMEDENAILTVSGDLSAPAFTSWSNSHQGTIILDGSTQQQLTNLAVHDLTVENEEGVKYGSDVKLYGTFDSQDTPIDCNSYLLQVCSSSVSFVGDGYDYGRIRVVTGWTFSGNAVFDTLDTATTTTITEGSCCIVKGKLYHSKDRLTINGSLHVMGDMEVSSGWNMSNYETVRNTGTIQVDGDLSMTYSGNGSAHCSRFNNNGTVDVNGNISLVGPRCYFSMEDENAILTVSGDLSAPAFTSWSNSHQGTIILDGSTQQQVTNLAVHDLTVENEEGVKYGSDVKLYGTFDSQDTPIDCNTYLLQVCSSSAAFAGNGYDYGRIRVVTGWSFSGNAVFDTLDTTTNTTITEGSRCTVKGKLYHSKDRLTINGSLHVMGDMEVSSGWNMSNYETVRNTGTVQVDGDLSMTYSSNGSAHCSRFNNNGTVDVNGNISLVGPRCYFSMEDENAILTVSGDLSAPAFTSWSNSHQGAIILDGSTQQQLTNLAVHDLTIENEEGVKYGSDVKLYGIFDSQDAPIDCNTYLLQVCSSSAAFAGNGYDYGRIRVVTGWTFSGNAVFDTLDTATTTTITEGSCCTVKGKLYHSKDRLTINGSLHVMGDMEVSSGWNMSNYETVRNTGTIQVDGDLSMTYSGNGSAHCSRFNNYGTVVIGNNISLVGPRCFFSQKDAAAELIVGGDCTGYSKLSTTLGTVRSLSAEETSVLIAELNPMTTVAAERARTSYDALSEWQKQFVSKYSVLTGAEEKLAQGEKFTLMGSNMTLGNDLCLNFAVGFSDLAEADGATAIITKIADGQIQETQIIPAEEWRSAKNYYLIGFPLAAAQMCDEVYVEIFDADGRALSVNYCDSIRDYAMRMLENAALSDSVKGLLVDMLNYGAAAQDYFGYNVSDPANALLTEAQQALASEKEAYTNDQLAGSNFYGTSLSLKDNILLNFHFSGLKGKDLSKMYAQIRFTDTMGQAYDYTLAGDRWETYGSSGNIYRIVVDKLVMSDARQPVTVLVYDEDGELFGSCTDSLGSYIKRTEGSSAAGALYDAIMRFSHSAYQYMTSK